MTASITTRSNLGFGLGLRVDHYETILNSAPAVDWFEIISENYLVPAESRCTISTAFASAIRW